MRKVPGSADAVGNDLVEGRRQNCARGKGALPGERLEEDDGKVVDIVGLEVETFLAFGSFANTVAAELDDLAHGKDIGRFDVLVDQIAAVQSLECGDETCGDLVGLFNGEGAVLKYFGEVSVGGFQERVDKWGTVNDGLAVFLQGNEVGLFDFGYLTPAVEDLGLVEVGFDETDDGLCSGTVGGGEEGAATFGCEQLVQGEDVCDRSSFVVVPKLHKSVHSWGIWLKEEGPLKASAAKKTFLRRRFARRTPSSEIIILQ